LQLKFLHKFVRAAMVIAGCQILECTAFYPCR